MAPTLELRVYDQHQLKFQVELSGLTEIGRQDKGEEGPYRVNTRTTPPRVILAEAEDRRVPRRHVQVEPLEGGKVRVTNISDTRSVRLHTGEELAPGRNTAVVGLPVLMTLGAKTVRIQEVESGQFAQLEGLASMSQPPPQEDDAFTRMGTLSLSPAAASSMDLENLVRWLQTATGVLHSAASSTDFYRRAAKAMVELVGLDTGRVLLRGHDEWRVEAQHASTGQGEGAWRASSFILRKLVEEKRTFWEVPEVAENVSLAGIKAVVAAPILDRKGAVIAALYGERRQDGLHAGRRITKLEGLLVDLLAGTVAAGLARVDQEKATLLLQAQMENFFTPRLAKLLTEQPEMLQGRDTEVTVLFCDIRGFSRISEKLGPAITVEWIADVLGALSECVLKNEGVVVDYIGDELMAMWGAPDQQPDHARRACQAALDMVACLRKLNERWQPQFGAAMDVGVGINTGIARVGNVGSRFKFKYGPLGNTVNLASRVQGANKYLKTRLLLTQGAFQQLPPGFPCRRLCSVRVVNIHEPVVLYELLGPYGDRGTPLKKGYEEALDWFEKKDFPRCAGAIGNLWRDFPTDGPSLVLMNRAVQCMAEEPAHFDPVWELPGK